MSKPTAIRVSDEDRKRAVASARRYLTEELELDADDLWAMLLVDYFMMELAPTIYNQAIADAQKFLTERVEDLGAVGYRNEFPFWPARSAKRGSR